MSTPNSTSSGHPEGYSLTTKGKVFKWGATLLITGLAAVGTKDIASNIVNSLGPNYTPAQLSKMNYVPTTAAPGETAEQMIRRVEPGILDNAEDRAEVIDYMVDDTGNQDGVVGEGETLDIPVEPGQGVLPGNKILTQ